jgi:nucleoside-diphosphate-sugar epimerase
MKMIPEFNNKSVLVTGGAGFIGSHLVEQLVLLGARVTVLDDLSTGTMDNLSCVQQHITFIRGTIIDQDTCIKAAQNCQIVFHLAAKVSVPESFENPNTCYKINMQGTQLMLEAARRTGVQRFVFASSCAAYGSHDGLLSENLPCHPQSPYGFSKLIGEMLCTQYMKDFGLETTCLRYFNVFGPRQQADGPYAGVVAKFRQIMANNQPLIIFGDGLQRRDFVHVNQVVEATLLAGVLPAARVCGQVYNVATGNSITLLQLIEQLKQEFPHYNAAIHHQPARPGDIQTVYADVSKCKELIF